MTRQGAPALPASSWLAALVAAAAFALLGACSRSEPEPRPEPKAEARPAPAAPPSAGPASAARAPAPPTGPLVLARGLRVVRAPTGSDAARVVREERDRSKTDGRELVVYVGAKWCEPCQYFHKAAESGALDSEFPDVTILEFDLDEDRDRLNAAGYVSELIPLFAIPGEDGRASDRKLAGSVKGDGAVANISPRLRALLKR